MISQSKKIKRLSPHTEDLFFDYTSSLGLFYLNIRYIFLREKYYFFAQKKTSLFGVSPKGGCAWNFHFAFCHSFQTWRLGERFFQKTSENIFYTITWGFCSVLYLGHNHFWKQKQYWSQLADELTIHSVIRSWIL